MVFDGEASRILILHRDQYSKRAAKIHVPVSTLLQALLDTRVPIWRGHHGKLTTVQEESPPWHDRSGRLAARPGAGNYRPHGQTEGEGETMKATKAKAIVLDTPEFRSEAEETESWDRLKDLNRRSSGETRPARRRTHEEYFGAAARERHRTGPGAGCQARRWLPDSHQNAAPRRPEAGVPDRMNPSWPRACVERGLISAT
jgi:hypothetical protein